MPPAAEEQEIIVRGSEEHKEYLKYRHGSIKDKVSAIEAFLAVTGRLVLVLYTVYVSVAAYLYNRLSTPLPVWFLILDIFMTALQVFGLEGSLAGLVHLRDDLVQRGKQAEANVIDGAIWSARLLLVASAIEIALELIGNVPGWDLSEALKFYTAALYVVRIFVISGYLIAMARLEHKGPRIISQYEAAKRAEAQEQKQIRIDNATIMAVVHQEFSTFMRSQPTFAEAVAEIKEAMDRRFEVTEAVHLQRMEAVQRTVEAAKIGSGVASPELVQEVVEPILNRFREELNRSIEAKFSDLDRKVHRLEGVSSTRTNSQTGNAPTPSGAKAPAMPAAAKITNIAEAREDKGSGISVAEALELLERDERLLKLSDAKLGEAVQASKATAHRAKKRYYELHPEAVQPTDTGETEAVNQQC